MAVPVAISVCVCVASMILELNIAIVPMVAHGKAKIFT